MRRPPYLKKSGLGRPPHPRFCGSRMVAPKWLGVAGYLGYLNYPARVNGNNHANLRRSGWGGG